MFDVTDRRIDHALTMTSTCGFPSRVYTFNIV